MGVMEQVLDTNPMKIHSDYGTFSEPPLHGEGAVKVKHRLPAKMEV